MFKKFCAIFIAVVFVFLSSASILVYIVDPFNHYRAPDDYTKIIYQNSLYQNVGIAKHAKFDTLITGSSMTQNFRANWFDEKFGCKAIRLSFDGGNIKSFDTLLDTALKGDKIKTVYFGIDNYNLTGETTNLTLSPDIPEYLYDENPFNDVNYLLNKDIIFKYLRSYFSYSLYKDYNFYEMLVWDNNTSYEYSKEAILKSYERESAHEESKFDFYSDFNNKTTELLIRHVSNNPETEFVFFAPPYSIFYWDSIVRKGKLNATLYSLEHTYKELLKYKNVKLFYFQSNTEIITDFNNYRDYSHYKTSVNKYMLDCFENGDCSVSASELESTLENMKQIVLNYNFDSLFDD